MELNNGGQCNMFLFLETVLNLAIAAYCLNLSSCSHQMVSYQLHTALEGEEWEL